MILINTDFNKGVNKKMIPEPDLFYMQQNTERITRLFKKYINQFTEKKMHALANHWQRILINYRRTVDRKYKDLANIIKNSR